MADLIQLPRATDATGAIVTDATAYIFDAGTSTPREVFAEKALSTTLGTSEAADAEGVFPALWVASGVEVKVDVRDSGGTSLPGYPRDYYGRFPEGGLDGDAVTFDPVTGNSATDVQAAIENNTSSLTVLNNAGRIYTSGGSANAYTLTPANAITAYANGQEFEFRANHASTGAATLNVSSVGAVAMQKLDNANAKTDLVSGDIAIGQIVRVKHDGTNFVVVSPLPGSSTVPGVVKFIDDDTMATASATNVASAESIVAYVASLLPTTAGPTATTSGSAHDFTSIPSGVNFITISFDQVSLSGTDDLLIQLSTSTTFATTGYVSTSGGTTSTGQSQATSTAGLVIDANALSAAGITGHMTLTRIPGTNTWVSSHAVRLTTAATRNGGGSVTLGGTLDGVRITRTGTNTFDAGQVAIEYR